MPTAKYFDACPPFPADAPIAPFAKVSLERLKCKDAEETRRLFDACREWGFFLLDLSGSQQGVELLQAAEKMHDLTGETFALDQEALDEFAFNPPKDLIGYKRQGVQRTDDGKKDCMELYSISQDDMLKVSSEKQYAKPIESRRGDVRTFMQQSHTVASVILSQLDVELGLRAGTLGALCPLGEPSATSLRILESQPQRDPEYDTITLGGHTDIGTLTLLFNVVGGLQILPAGSERKMENWRFVKPEPGFVIVNLGDTMVEWTGGVLRSGLHRVVTAPGEQATVPRRSVVYLLRPRASATMRRLESATGGVIPVLGEDEVADDQLVNDWAAVRSKQILLGQLRPETRGGSSLSKSDGASHGLSNGV